MTFSGGRLVGAAIGVGILAIGARLGVVLLGGGLAGRGNYDDTVYFSAADAWVHGRWPYRDFLFLQPPGILLVLAPFAALGEVLGDARAFVLARLAFLILGGLNAALIVGALRRFGAAASMLGGVFYALSVPAVYSERSTLLEPVGTLGVLFALAVLLWPEGLGSGRHRVGSDRLLLLLAGLLLGLGVIVKVWYALPAAVIIVAARRRAGPLLVGGAAAGAAGLSFAFAAPARAWQQVVLDQLGRPRIAGYLPGRLFAILQPPRPPGVPAEIPLVIAALAVAGLCVVVARVPGARIFVVLLVSTVALLMVTPSYYRHYAGLAVPPLALVVGVGAARVVARFAPPGRRDLAGRLAVAAVGAGCILGWPGTGFRSFSQPPLPADLTRAVGSIDGCVTADDPSVLIWSNVLTDTLGNRCPFWPDVTGWLYDADATAASAEPVTPDANPAWQAHAYGYLTSGAATVLARRNSGLSSETRARIGVTTTYGSGRYVLRILPR